jgi:1,4-dihydroxy-2-naphthoate octaprenyltransferase
MPQDKRLLVASLALSALACALLFTAWNLTPIVAAPAVIIAANAVRQYRSRAAQVVLLLSVGPLVAYLGLWLMSQPA